MVTGAAGAVGGYAAELAHQRGFRVLGGSAAMGAVRDGGAFVALIPPATPPVVRDIRVLQIMARSDPSQLRHLVALAEEGRLTTRVARTFRFEEAAQAHTAFALGGVRSQGVSRQCSK